MKIPALKKGQLYTIGIAAVVVIIIVIVVCINYTKIKNWISEKKYENEIDAAIDTSNVRISAAMMRQYADRLYTAMKGLGTAEEAIYSIFACFTTDDEVLQLIKVYGTRDGETLPQWIAGDLSNKERKKLNLILTNNGVSYQF